MRGRPVIHPEGYTIKTFLIPNEQIDLWKEAEKLAAREGKMTISDVIVKALADYLNLHLPGNPQCLLKRTTSDYEKYQRARVITRLKYVLAKKDWGSKWAHLESLHKWISESNRVKKPSRELKQLTKTAIKVALEIEGSAK